MDEKEFPLIKEIGNLDSSSGTKKSFVEQIKKEIKEFEKHENKISAIKEFEGYTGKKIELYDNGKN
ncbi:hypothetical protein [Clostridium puniceum]|uniref:hypothetical protein n=1 Tax=Clostridium puniceum TaxID=29367 RepID=UPI00098C45AC|nr:hypothetical protein [Clostridium puniceum]